MPTKAKRVSRDVAKLPSIPKELVNLFLTGPMTGEAINDAGAIAVGDNARIFHHKTSAAPPIAVGWIDAGGMETNPDLADRGFRIRKFTKRENLCGRPLPIIPDGFHIITYFTGLLSKSEGSEPLGGSP